MLITMPDHDLATVYASTWSKEIIDIAERNGINPHVIRGKSVIKSHVASTILEKNPRFLMFNGHGSDTVIAGHKLEPIIILGENHYLLKDRIVHSFTCGSGKELGRQCGAKAFIGYSDWFFLCMDGNSITRPLEDIMAIPVMESAMEVPKQIVKKKTVREAFNKSQQKYQNFINEYTVSDSKYTTAELQLILPCLQWNKNCQVIFGDDNAKLD